MVWVFLLVVAVGFLFVLFGVLFVWFGWFLNKSYYLPFVVIWKFSLVSISEERD